MQITNKAVMEALDGLPQLRYTVLLLAEEAIHAALWDYSEAWYQNRRTDQAKDQTSVRKKSKKSN